MKMLFQQTAKLLIILMTIFSQQSILLCDEGICANGLGITICEAENTDHEHLGHEHTLWTRIVAAISTPGSTSPGCGAPHLIQAHRLFLVQKSFYRHAPRGDFSNSDGNDQSRRNLLAKIRMVQILV